jgi:hypothetical protein
MQMKTWMLITLALAVSVLGFSPAAHGQENLVTLQALMIQAQNEPAPIDRRLEKVEYKLRRVFGFQFYRYVGEGNISLLPGGEGSIELPDGHRLHVRRGGKGGAEVRWSRNDEALLSTSVNISRDAPVVLGGIPSNGGKLIVVLTAQ